MSQKVTPKPKRRRFHLGTFVESTDVLNKAAHRFVIKVRYYSDYTRNTDYVIVGPRKYLRE